MERSSGTVKTACDLQIDGRLGARRPKLTWKKLTQLTLKKGALGSAMHAASQLPGRGPNNWMMPLHVNQKSDYNIYRP